MLESPSLKTRKSRAGSLSFTASRQVDEYEPIRDKISAQANKFYSGWDSTFDRQFDAHSIFFFLRNDEDEVLAASRLVLSDETYPIPSELADHPLVLDAPYRDTVGEYSGFWFYRPKYGIALACLGARWILENLEVRDIYAVFDAESRLIRDMHLSSMSLRLFEHPPIVFESFTRRSTGDPVSWILTLDCAEKRAMRMQSMAAIPSVNKLLETVTI